MSSATQTVREIALENPASIRVFEALGIDYCCGGRKPLAEACQARSISVDEVLSKLEESASAKAEPAIDWSKETMSGLAAYIVNKHHTYINAELPRLALLAEKVVSRHGEHRPELKKVAALFAQLSDELTSHLGKEEMVLFPYIEKMELAAEAKGPRPASCFGSVVNPIAMMTREHDAAGEMMAAIRALTSDFQPPADACPTYRGFYQGLYEFEQDLHRHIHLENNLLFPRAVALEAAV